MPHKTINAQARTFALAFACALAILGPGSALAKSPGADRHLTGSLSGTISVNVATGAIVGDDTGHISHLGTASLHYAGVVTPTAEAGTYVGSADVVIVAANGDRLTGTADVTSRATATGQTTTVVVTITGGTGRFAHAHGTLTFTCISSSLHQEGDVLIGDDQCTVDGHLTYGERHRARRHATAG